MGTTLYQEYRVKDMFFSNKWHEITCNLFITNNDWGWLVNFVEGRTAFTLFTRA